MTPVAAITTEDEPDLVVSFVLGPAAGEVLTLARSPQYEPTLPPHERGVSVSRLDPDDQESDLLQRLLWEEATVSIRTGRHDYRLDVSGVDAEEVAEAKAVLRRMAADGAAYIEGV